jgi:hypothetical protein
MWKQSILSQLISCCPQSLVPLCRCHLITITANGIYMYYYELVIATIIPNGLAASSTFCAEDLSLLVLFV